MQEEIPAQPEAENSFVNLQPGECRIVAQEETPALTPPVASRKAPEAELREKTFRFGPAVLPQRQALPYQEFPVGPGQPAGVAAPRAVNSER